MQLPGAIGEALRAAFAMFWQVLWPLALGFLLSAVVETYVSKRAVSRLLGSDSAGSLVIAAGFGAASSSCSYAATALARSLFRRGATLRNAIIFEFASTNLVFELGLVLLALLGWQFLAGEVSGGVLMILLIALLFRVTLRPWLVEAARRQSEKGLSGRMEGHAAMDMSVTEGPILRRVFSGPALTSVSHYYFMNVYSLWLDLAVGLLVAGALSAWVPGGAWSALFLRGHGPWTEVWGAVIGPLVAMVTFVCSVGNIPLAAVLWRGGISFSGAIAFIFADLLILPILDIYRRYYSTRVALYLAAVSYVAMTVAGLAAGAAFRLIGIVPTSRHVGILQSQPVWDTTTALNLVFLALSAVLAVRFLRTGGVPMLRAMEAMPGEDATHCGAV